MSETVTIDRVEYDRLLALEEEFNDIVAYDRVHADLLAGDDELIPADFARRLITGDSPVRVYRELRGMTQAQLGEASGVNRVQIANIEAGRKNGSIETVRKLAVALKVRIDDLV